MSCNTCQTKFSLFTRDIGCPNCGFSHCNKCLKYKCDVPNVGTKRVCGRCYKLNQRRNSNSKASMNDASMSNAAEGPVAPIDITMKLDSLENPAKPPVVMYKNTNRWDTFKKGLEPADQQIVDRLQKLKDKEQSTPLLSIEEIKRRLALLKDQDPEANGNSNVVNIYQVDTRTDQQKTDDLIQEYLAQLDLSSSNDPCKEIQGRLSSLRDEDDEMNQDKREIDDDEGTVTKKLIDKAVAEAMLEAKYEDKELEDVEPMDS